MDSIVGYFSDILNSADDPCQKCPFAKVCDLNSDDALSCKDVILEGLTYMNKYVDNMLNERKS